MLNTGLTYLKAELSETYSGAITWIAGNTSRHNMPSFYTINNTDLTLKNKPF